MSLLFRRGGARPLPHAAAKAKVLLGLALLTAAGAVPAWSQARLAGSFSSDQAERGRDLYEQRCAECHLSSLAGTGEAPELRGPSFQKSWQNSTVADLSDTIRVTMPPESRGTIDSQQALNIVAFLLQSSGVPAGDATLSSGSPALDAQLTLPEATTPASSSVDRDRSAQRTPTPEDEGPAPGERVLNNFVPVTDATLHQPDPGDWLMYRRTYDGHGYSPLDQIDRENVGSLRLAWSWAIENGVNQPTPLVYRGVLYLANPANIIQALEADTGNLIWEYRRELTRDQARGFNQLRNLAIWDDKIFVATKDAAMLALDARSGEPIWETQIADPAKSYSNTSGPIVVDGKVINGINGCSRYFEDSCFITAHDAETGEELWRTFTIARPGEPGGDTWGDVPLMMRAGGDSWIPGSYDPELRLLYWPVAQAKPWVPVSRGMSVDQAALYTNSTLALRPDDGSLAFYRQHVPGEALDLDEAFEQVLVDVGDQKLLFTIGKHGILWKLDRTTGKFLGFKEAVFQNVFDHIDRETGEVRYREDIASAKVGEWISVCPSTAGGHNWQASSYSPKHKLLIIPLSQSCLEIAGREVTFKEGGGGTQADRKWFAMPNSDGKLGKLAAFDVETLEQVWSVEQRPAFLTAALATAGDVVFAGDINRYFRAYDLRDGSVLWETRLPTSVQGFPVSYSVNGVQYVTVTTGLGGGSPRFVPASVSPEIRYPRAGNALFVFRLPESIGTAR